MKQQLKILAVGDQESKFLWDFYQPGRLDDVDLILSAGDLDPHYLSFLATFCHGPVLYVHGNHDDKYEQQPPEGCICIEDEIFYYKGIRIVGFGGSMRYNQGYNQYSEREMARRIRKMRLKLAYYGGCDILLTHAPARGLNDGSDRTHAGFECFRDFLDKYHPTYFVHSHIHPTYQDGFVRMDKYHGSTVVNAYEKVQFAIEAEEYEQKRGNR